MVSEGRAADAIVIGAGIAGLACARSLHDAGKRVIVIDRARGVGGRCATRRIDEQPIDFGVLFLHGRDPELLAALDAVPGARVPGWPAIVQGAGRPCQPEAFAPGEQRVAFADGVSAFPKHLARDLDLRLGARAIAIEDGPEARVLIEGGDPFTAPVVIVALAVEQAIRLLEASPASKQLASARALLGMVRSQPCLTVVATYPIDVPLPAFHLHHPEGSRVIQVASHDSSKRPSPARRALVFQAHARWSREHVDAADWPAAILAEAGALLGGWAASPATMMAHRWRYARTDHAAELSAPLYLRLPAGSRVGLAGELFAPGGGVEAAFLSGCRLARQILAEERG